MNLRLYILLIFLCSAALVRGQGTIVFKDTFESYSAGKSLHDVVPEAGYRWYDYGTAGRDIVSTDYAREGFKGAYVRRDASGAYTFPVLTARGSFGSEYEVFPGGEPFYFTFSWYQANAGYDRPSVWADFGNFSGIAGVRVAPDNTYHIWDDSRGGDIATGVQVIPGTWEKIQMIFYPGADQGQGNVRFSYDAYVIRANGTRLVLAEDALSKVRQLAMQAGQYAYNNAQLAFYNEPPTSSTPVKPFYDEVYIIKDYVPQCGYPEYQAPKGDLNGDCQVDLADFAVLAQNWML